MLDSIGVVAEGWGGESTQVESLSDVVTQAMVEHEDHSNVTPGADCINAEPSEKEFDSMSTEEPEEDSAPHQHRIFPCWSATNILSTNAGEKLTAKFYSASCLT